MGEVTPAEVSHEVTAHAVPVAVGYHGYGFGHYYGKREADPAVIAGRTTVLNTHPPDPQPPCPPCRPCPCCCRSRCCRCGLCRSRLPWSWLRTSPRPRRCQEGC